MNRVNPKKSIVPIVSLHEDGNMKELLGTGSLFGKDKNVYILTAKHIFESDEEQTSEKFGFFLLDRKELSIFEIQKILPNDDFDISFCIIEHLKEMTPLQFSKEQPSLNTDVFCYEFSSTSIETKNSGDKHVTFQPLAHKGNIMRSFESEFPEKVKTPCFTTSFPALQGASGAPIMSATKGKNFYIAGMMVANQETHLMPAQVVKIENGKNYLEETKYFLPTGKAINASLIAQIIEKTGLEIEYVD